MSQNESNEQQLSGGVRIHIDSEDMKYAEVVAQEFLSVFSPHLNVKIKHIKPYWKISKHLEIAFEFTHYGTLKDTLVELMKIGTGWKLFADELEDGYAIWIPEAGGTFINKDVRWAYINCFPTIALHLPVESDGDEEAVKPDHDPTD